ncbi:MAG: ATP-dependent DNA ligase [Actinomycetota bacterium]
MLARLEDTVPEGEEWRFEPKWDGFRALVFRDGDEIAVQSRDTRPLERYFPEVVSAVASLPPGSWVVDGEVLIMGSDGLDFGALLQRIHPAASRIQMLAEKTPATLVVFDILAAGSKDLRGSDDDARREELERWAASIGVGAAPEELDHLAPGPEILLTPRTKDRDTAMRWYADEVGIGQDGLIARRGDLLYREGERAMVKIKHRRTVDCVVGGYRLAKDGEGVASLLLGLYGGDVLHYVGHTSSFRAPQRRELLERLAPLEGEGGFGRGRSPGGLSRWTAGRSTEWTPLRPELVCEVSIDRMQGERFRHAATFQRWRDDRDPATCTFDQLSSGRR